ncbi:MAG TPA: ATP-binding protein, partial [Thermomicrobiales bacterium]|nr:ATP-binding protein [Thermomicrobiales bacterium]
VRGISSMSQQEERPQRTARQSARIIDTMLVGVVTVERDYHIRSINVAARRLMNLHSAAMGEDLIHRVPAELAQALRTGIDDAFQGETITTDLRLNRDVVDDGGRDFTVTFAPVPSEREGESVEFVTLEIVDISMYARQRRDMERAMAALQAERDHLHDRMLAAIAEIRELRAAGQTMAIEHGRLRAENEQLQLTSEEAQAAAEEIETLNEEQQASNEELETLNEELQATVEELNTTNADLQARTIELEALAHTNERQRRESERERARLQAMLTNMSEAVLVLSASEDVVLTNPAWDRLLGPPGAFVPEDEAGQPLPDSVWSFRRVLAGEPFTLEFTRPAADGTRRWFEASVQPIPGDGEQSGMVVVRDITDRSLRRLQERFLAIASHELRTPMTTLSGSIQLMARRLGNQPSDLGKHVDRAWEQIRRLQLIVGELTDISRLRGGMFEVDMREVDLRDVVRDAVDIAGDLSGQTRLRPEIPDEPVIISGDAARLEQVLLNLMINAFRHARDSRFLDVRLRRDDHEAVIEVQDYGPGIPEPSIPEIFTQFNRATHEARSQSGLGLGLFIAREIVTAHRGTVDVRSTVGEGATFEVRLPLLSS